MNQSLSHTVHWGNTQIRYKYEFSNRKTLAINVHPDLSVTVNAPIGTPTELIKEKIRRRGPWIRKAWLEFELYLPKQPPRRYINGETHRYLGRQYRLKSEQSDKESVKCLCGYFWVSTKKPPEPGMVKKLLDIWYREKARKIFQERHVICLKPFPPNGKLYPPFTIRKMATRWGSCSKSGRITLNLELIKAPKDCIDYVITHELCHLREKHHGPRFWRLLERIMPNYRERRKKLNQYADV